MNGLEVSPVEEVSLDNTPFALCTIGQQCKDGHYRFCAHLHDGSTELVTVEQIIAQGIAQPLWAVGPPSEQALSISSVQAHDVKASKINSIYAVEVGLKAPNPTPLYTRNGGVVAFTSQGGGKMTLKGVLSRDLALLPLSQACGGSFTAEELNIQW